LAAYDLLSEAREEIDTDLGMERDYGTATEWRTVSKTMRSIGSSMVADEPLAPENWEKTKVFFKDAINRYVNTFRHRLERIASDSMRAS
jgi:hypothetical protein